MAGKLTRKPKGKSKQSVDEFISGAGQGATVSSNIISYDTNALPWEAPGVREDVLKIYNLRLPEPYLLKLKFIAEKTPDSMQKFCLDALLPAIDAKIKELIKN